MNMGLREEEQLLLDLSRVQLTPQAADDLRKRIAEPSAQRWSRLIELAITHRVVCLLAHNLDHYDLYPTGYLPGTLALYKNALRLIYAANAQHNEELIQELSSITELLSKKGIHVVVRKGPALLQELYGDLGARQMADLDLLIDPDEVLAAVDLLSTMGYARDMDSDDGVTLAPVPRQVALYRRMHVPNVVLFRGSSNRFTPWFKVDISLNLFLPSTDWSMPSTRLRERSRSATLFGVPAHVLTPEETLVDLATHLYKEATTLVFINNGKDLNLYKFVDIAELARTDSVNWNAFQDLVAEHGIAAPVYYALHYTEILFPGVMPAAVLDRLRPANLAYLDHVGQADQVQHRWSMPFPRRLFEAERADEVPRSRAQL